MGKNLIIKGADFSANGFPSETTMELAQGTIGGSSNVGIGNWDFSSPNYNSIRLKTAKTAGIYIPNGESVSLGGMTGLGYGYFVYSQNNPTTENCLGLDYCVKHPSLNTENEEVITDAYINNTGQNVWIWFIFKWNGMDGIHEEDSAISPSSVEISYLLS